MNNNKKYSLVSQVRLKISIRVLTSLLLSMLVLMFLTYRDISGNLQLLNKKLNTMSQDLEDFIISQVLIESIDSVNLKISEINKSESFRVEWLPKTEAANTNKMNLKMPFNWEYFHNIKALDGRKFGELYITGALYDGNVFISVVIEKILLVLSFFIFLLVLLLPLSKKIPQEMMLNPIADILSLLRNPDTHSEDNKLIKLIEVEEIKSNIIKLIAQIKKDSHDIAIGKIAAQVAHDIRSPVAALDVAAQNILTMSEEQRLIIRNSTQRIKDIANNLLSKYKQYDTSNTINLNNIKNVSLIMTMLETIVSEKRAQFHDLDVNFELNINSEAYSLFTTVNSIEFKRMISNFINNSVESIVKNGFVKIVLSQVGDSSIIKIYDNGIGISPDILPNLFIPDFAVSKKGGCGLGLNHAYFLIKSNHGNINIESKVNVGTTVTIELPSAYQPAWFVNQIDLHDVKNIVVFDDDLSIHNVWSQRFSALMRDNLNFKINVIHLYSPNQLRGLAQGLKFNFNNYFFLMDYEIISENINGVDLIQELQIHNNSILVTGCEDIEVIERCNQLGIYLLPKMMSAFVPLVINTAKLYDAILIDDDLLVRSMWELSAENNKKIIQVFSKTSQFFKNTSQFDFKTHIFIDSNLGLDIKGEDIAKEIYDKGFKNIYLVTGSEAAQFSCIPWLSGVLGKSPPWES